MKPQLEARAAANSIPLRVIDIKKWGSPVATQYEIQSIPAVWMYRDGKIVSKDYRHIMQKLST